LRRFAEDDPTPLPFCNELQACEGVDQFQVHRNIDRS
jgi:hypothetical protein